MIYVHVPFCRSFCSYCGFYSELCAGREEQMDAYAQALCREAAARAAEYTQTVRAAGESIDTLYIGGGTPSVLPLAALKSIVDCLRAEGLCGAEPVEFTLEVNPDDILHRGMDYLRSLRELGVNRISMGVQSFDDARLRLMNRRHGAADAVRAFRMLREAGFANISIDLIYGMGEICGEPSRPEQWEASLDRTLELRPEHISAYQLSLEPGSILEKLQADGRFRPADDETCVREWELLCHRLDNAGYVHYEISNFALLGYEAVHNSAYWRHVPYLGLGPAAHSLALEAGGKWKRSWNPSDLGLYLAAWGPGSSPGGGNARQEREYEILDDEQLRLESIMLGLRTASGIRPEVLGKEALERGLSCGDLVYAGDRVRIAPERLFVSDSIIASLV